MRHLYGISGFNCRKMLLIVAGIMLLGFCFAAPCIAQGQDLSNKKLSERTYSQEKERSQVIVRYPVFQNSQTAGEKAFNKTVADYLNARVKIFNDALKSYTVTNKASWTYQSHYNVTHLSPTLVSVMLVGYQYTGGANGSYEYRTVLFDMAKSKELALSDLFKPNSRYLKRISAICIKELGEKPELNKKMIAGGAAAKLKNYRYFTVSDQGLAIIFPPYQVGCRADGEQQVLIPYERLADILDPSGPVYRLVNDKK